MIKHIVLWTLKNRENERSRDETAAGIKEKIEAMRGKIPGLLHIEGYHVHPAHEAFKAFIGPSRSQRSLIDYEV